MSIELALSIAVAIIGAVACGRAWQLDRAPLERVNRQLARARARRRR